MKIAYLIAAHNLPAYVDRLVTSLNSENSRFFLHVDDKSAVEDFLYLKEKYSNLEILGNRVKVYWGGWSQVQASLNLIDAARNTGEHFHRFVLLSALCYPVVSIKRIEEVLSRDVEYISCTPMPDLNVNKPVSRLNRWHFEGGYREKGFKSILIKLINLALCLPFLKRNVSKGLCGIVPYAGSNWWALTDKTIDRIIDYCHKNPGFVSFHRHVKNPDESFFQTLVKHVSTGAVIEKSLTYADWSDPVVRPSFINSSHIDGLIKKGYRYSDYFGDGDVVFVRKIPCPDFSVRDYIDGRRL